MTTTCPDCGVAYAVGQWYACPHDPIRAGRGADVTWPGGRTFENLGDQPMTFYSPAEQARYMKSHGIESYVQHVPTPGSDKSPHTTSWSGISQWQMDGARAMLERSSTASDPAPQTWVERFKPSTEVGVTRVMGRR